MHPCCLAGCLWWSAEQWVRNCALRLLVSLLICKPDGWMAGHCLPAPAGAPLFPLPCSRCREPFQSVPSVWGRTQALKWQYVQQKHKWGWFSTAGKQALSLRPVTGNLAFPFLQEIYVWWKWLYMALLHLLFLSFCLPAFLILAWISLSLEQLFGFWRGNWVSCLLLGVCKEGKCCWVRTKHLDFQFRRDAPVLMQTWGKALSPQRWLEGFGSWSFSVTDTMFKMCCLGPGL